MKLNWAKFIPTLGIIGVFSFLSLGLVLEHLSTYDVVAKLLVVLGCFIVYIGLLVFFEVRYYKKWKNTKFGDSLINKVLSLLVFPLGFMMLVSACLYLKYYGTNPRKDCKFLQQDYKTLYLDRYVDLYYSTWFNISYDIDVLNINNEKQTIKVRTIITYELKEDENSFLEENAYLKFNDEANEYITNNLTHVFLNNDELTKKYYMGIYKYEHPTSMKKGDNIIAVLESDIKYVKIDDYYGFVIGLKREEDIDSLDNDYKSYSLKTARGGKQPNDYLIYSKNAPKSLIYKYDDLINPAKTIAYIVHACFGCIILAKLITLIIYKKKDKKEIE